MRFFSVVKSDLLANMKKPNFLGFLNGLFFSPGFRVVLFHRVSAALSKKSGLLRILGKAVWRLNVAQSGCYISPDSNIGDGLFLPHPTGVVIGEGARVGSGVTVYQHVTLGRAQADASAYPKLGKGVIVYAGAVVVGGIEVGDQAVVGANAVVLKNVPCNARAVGNPARNLM